MTEGISQYSWVNGRFIEGFPYPIETSPINHSEDIYLYNTVRGPAIFRLEEHIDRLEKLTKVTKTYPAKELFDACIQVVNKNTLKQGCITVKVSHDDDVVITCKTDNEQTLSTPRSIKIVSDTHKSNEEKNNYETISFDTLRNKETQTTGTLFVVKGKKAFTPSLNLNTTDIATRTVVALLEDTGIEVEEKQISLREARQADEIFLVQRAIISISSIDNTTLADYLTTKVKDTLAEIVGGRSKKFDMFLTFL
jgi:branched-chain amino acid aminotransferase